MKLSIIEPVSKKEIEVVWIEANTPDGSFIIQNGHASTALVLAVNKELIYCFKTGKQEAIRLKKGGILEVQLNHVTVLVG